MPTRSSGFFIQGTHGTRGNFEVVIPRAGGGIAHLWRNNDAANFPWSALVAAFGSTGDVTGVSLIQGNYGPAGNLEVVAREGNRLIHNWRDDGASWRWQQAAALPGAVVVSGPPALIQGAFGTKGNFEVVAPLAGGGMGHWWRNNDAGNVWNGPFRFGAGAVSAVALLQSNYGSPGNLEVVARVGSDLVHYYRDAAGWHGPFPFATGAAGVPSFIQGSFGTRGNFEVVSPLAGGGLGHWWRANDAAAPPWRGPTRFGSGTVQAVGLIQSNFAAPDGPLEVVARTGAVLQHYYRDAAGWQGPFVIHREAACPAARGRAEIPFGTGVVGVHMGVMRNGKVALWGFNDAGGAQFQSRVLDPATGALQTPTACHHNPHLFCGGQAFLASGELLVAGGHAAHTIRELHSLDPGTQTWTHRGTMAHGRWYPTVTALPDGRMLLLSGTVNGGGPHAGNPVNNTTEIFDPATGTIGPENPLPLPFSAHFPADFRTIDLYPFTYVLPSGKVLVHSRNTTRFFNPPAAGTAGGSWDPLQLRTVSPVSRSWPGAGTSVILPLLPSESYRPRVMVIGGAGAEGAALGLETPAQAAAEILDLGVATPAWKSLPPMAQPRVMADAVLLPNGKVLVVSGSTKGRADLAGNPVFQVQWFDPATSAWTTLCSTRVPRLYHSTALLLPDGRVLIAGKDGAFQPPAWKYPELRAEIFSPPYLFAGARPVFSGAPAAAGYGAAITVQTPDPAAIGSVALVRAGSVTHSFNSDQRMVGLTFTRGAGTITLHTPPNPCIAPRGYYMLFLMSTAGVPSMSTFLRLQ